MQGKDKTVTVIIPAYNEETMISAASTAVTGILQREEIPYQLIFIDDGSSDDTWDKICTEASLKKEISGIKLSRNFGKEAAIFAGLERAKSGCCVVMDCDLQHPPEKILEMYRLWEEGYEIVEGVKEDRGEERSSYGFAANLFYRIISRNVGIDMKNASDFKLLDRKVVDALNRMPEKSAFFRAMSYWVGYNKTEIFYKVQRRETGKSKWHTAALIKYALKNISSFSSAPMQFVTVCGVIMLIVAAIFGTISLVQKFTGQAVEGFTTVILILLFSSSLIMISLGIIGYYIAKIYEEIKGRPRYIVSERCGEKYE